MDDTIVVDTRTGQYIERAKIAAKGGNGDERTGEIAYLKGVIHGLGPVKDEGQNKIFAGLIDALEALSREVAEQAELIEELRDMYDELADDCAILDEDLDSLERAFSDYTGEDYAPDEHDWDDDADDEYDGLYFSRMPVLRPQLFLSAEYEEGEPFSAPTAVQSFAAEKVNYHAIKEGGLAMSEKMYGAIDPDMDEVDLSEGGLSERPDRKHMTICPR